MGVVSEPQQREVHPEVERADRIAVELLTDQAAAKADNAELAATKAERTEAASMPHVLEMKPALEAARIAHATNTRATVTLSELSSGAQIAQRRLQGELTAAPGAVPNPRSTRSKYRKHARGQREPSPSAFWRRMSMTRPPAGTTQTMSRPSPSGCRRRHPRSRRSPHTRG